MLGMTCTWYDGAHTLFKKLKAEAVADLNAKKGHVKHLS